MIDEICVIGKYDLFTFAINKLIHDINEDSIIYEYKFNKDIISKIKENNPYLIILEYENTNEMDNLIQNIIKTFPSSKLILMSDNIDLNNFNQYKNNIGGLLFKNYSISKLKTIFQLILIDEKYIPPELLETKKSILTPQQIQILEKLNLGYSNKKIAYDLGISVSTTRMHLYAIMKKLNVSNRMLLIKKALNMGLLKY